MAAWLTLRAVGWRRFLKNLGWVLIRGADPWPLTLQEPYALRPAPMKPEPSVVEAVYNMYEVKCGGRMYQPPHYLYVCSRRR